MRWTLGHIRFDRRGATAIEYAMIAFFISIAGFAAIQTIGTHVNSVFSTIASSF
ncbi:MAG TPA: Flp family type IVb pilin [Stellaceae bacterium]|nr:Flp family type IVb pilin [Stellaceae bacterium]